MKDRNTHFLDGIRGLAALYVLLHHTRWLLAENMSTIQHSSTNFWILIQSYGFTFFRFGHQAVLVFFILSGFVINLSVSNHINSRYLDINLWLNYIKRRASRLYPAFIFALFLTFCLDFIGSNWLHYSFYRNGSHYSSFHLTNANFSFIALLGNLFFLMKTYVPIFGTNMATWSLGYEWWFYILFPIFYIIHYNNKYLASILQIGFFLLALLFSTWPIQILHDIFGMMLIWWLGVILGDLYSSKKILYLKKIGFFILLLPIIIYRPFTNILVNDLVWSLGLMGLLSILLILNSDHLIIKILNKLDWLGLCSYTIYIIHLPILYFLHSFILENDGEHLPLNFLYVYLFAIFIIILSYYLSFIIEKPFYQKKSILVS